MIRFIKVKDLRDVEIVYGLFITKKFVGKGRVQLGDYYITVNENKKTYMILIEDLDKSNIANCIYDKEWFNENIMTILKNIITNKVQTKKKLITFNE